MAEEMYEFLQQIRERAAVEPLAVDISDYSDEFVQGFLAGQESALLYVERTLSLVSE